MKYGRLILGAFVILIAGWVIVGEQLSGISANAFVNARLSTLRAPVAGTVSMPVRALGARVMSGEDIAQIADRLVDNVRLHDLLLEEGLVASEMARLGAQQATTIAAIIELEARESSFAREWIAELELRLDHARARLAILETATGDGALAEPTTEGPSADPRLTGLALEDARERVGVLEITLHAARAGAYLGDGINDAPHVAQRRLVLQSVLTDTEASLAAAVAQHAALLQRVGLERLRVNRLGGAALTATADGLIWSVLAADGETVERGQDVLQLLDCRSLIVTLSVTESIFNQLRPGDSAVFRFMGDSRRYDGSVIRLAGAGAASIYQNLAVAPGQRHLERYDVALLVPELRDDPAVDCPVGRTGRVFFESRPLDWLRNLRFW